MDTRKEAPRSSPEEQHEQASQPLSGNPYLPYSQPTQSMGSASTTKVAIPPLRPRADPAPAVSPVEKKRTSKACVECRSRKIKCTGRKPTCDHCEQVQVPCVYAEGKREQNRRATERGDRLLQALRELSNQVTLPPHIQALLTEIPDDDQSVLSAQTTASKKRRKSPDTQASEKRLRSASPGSEFKGEADVSADVGSEESVDLAVEDYSRNEKSRATGFIGKSSEVAWAQRLAHEQAGGSNSQQMPYGGAGMSLEARTSREAASKKRHAPQNQRQDTITDYTYHLDNESVLLVEYVDKNELPPPDMAKKLLTCYMDTVQDVCPIVTKSEFLGQFQHYLRSNNPERLPAVWRAILNMVFAIGAKFSHLINAPWRGDDRDHLIYYTRAIQLGVPNDVMVAHPDLQRIQVLGLVSFYYLSIGQVSRSWIMIGLACRQAVALGLHLRNLGSTTTSVSREKRVRVWWSLYYIEYLLCEVTGRPTAINHLFCSAPTPAPIDEGTLSSPAGAAQLEEWNTLRGSSPPSADAASTPVEELEAMPTRANHFRHRTLLAVLTQKVFVNLYSVHTVSLSWEEAQKSILDLGKELDQWYNTLPAEFQFARPQKDGAFLRERVLLAFGYYSTKLLLNRPCLCRIDRRIQAQGQHSKNLDDEKARECIMAANSITDLFPTTEIPDVTWAYTNGPWWCIVHHLMQSITVLMLELAFEVCHMKNPSVDRDAIVETAKKLVRWLSMMAATGNQAAKSACKQAQEQFKGFAPFESVNISALIEVAESGPEMLKQHFSAQAQAQAQAEAQEIALQQPDTMAGPGNTHQQSHIMEDVPMQGYGATDAQQQSPTQQFQQQPDIAAQSQQTLPFHNTVGFEYQPAQATQSGPEYSNDQSWQGEPWDINSNTNWNSLILQTSYDLSNPFTPFAGQHPGASFSSSEANFPMGQASTGPTHNPLGSDLMDVSQVGSTSGMYEAAMADVDQHHQQQSAQFGHDYQQYLPSSAHQHYPPSSEQQQYPPSSEHQQ